MIKSDFNQVLRAFFLDWCNNWGTPEKMASHYGITVATCEDLINVGRCLHESSCEDKPRIEVVTTPEFQMLRDIALAEIAEIRFELNHYSKITLIRGKVTRAVKAMKAAAIGYTDDAQRVITQRGRETLAMHLARICSNSRSGFFMALSEQEHAIRYGQLVVDKDGTGITFFIPEKR